MYFSDLPLISFLISNYTFLKRPTESVNSHYVFGMVELSVSISVSQIPCFHILKQLKKKKEAHPKRLQTTNGYKSEKITLICGFHIT